MTARAKKPSRPQAAPAAPADRPARALDAAAAAAGLLVAAAIYAPRLPHSADFLLPRRAGFFLFRWAMALWSHRWAPSALSILALLAGLAFVAALIWNVLARARAEPKTLRGLSYGSAAARGALVAAGAAAATLLARVMLATALDVVENAWFMPESVDLREPLILALLFVGAFVAAARAAVAFASWALLGATRARARAWAVPAGRLAAAALLFAAVASARYDAGKPGLAAAAGLPADAEPRPRLVALLSSDEGGPQTRVHEVPVASDQLDAVEAYARADRSVHRRNALAHLYAGRTMAMDASGLRRALLLGVSLGDSYARLLLLDHLQSAPPGAEARAALEALGDETRLRVGPKACARLALAWARQGDLEAARRWLARASQGPGALPPGLVELPALSGPLKPGRVSGRVRAPGPAVAALYSRRDALQPALLGPGQLVASAPVGRDGRFRFEGLPAGAYYMAVAVEPSRPIAREQLRARGRRGDLILSARRASIDGVALELGR